MADSTVKKEILLPSERKMSRKERLDYTWHDMKRNYMCYLMLLPFMLLFLVFTVIPVIMSLPMGFTDFDMASAPKFVGLQNFYTLFLADDVFIQSIRTTLIFAIFTGPLSYAMSFLLAWLINELHPTLKTLFTLIFYAPSMAGNIYFVWQLIFSGECNISESAERCGFHNLSYFTRAYKSFFGVLPSAARKEAARQALHKPQYVNPCVVRSPSQKE